MNAKLKIFSLLIFVLAGLHLSAAPGAWAEPLSAPPSNDLFQNAKVLTGASGNSTGTNSSATREDWEPAHAGQPARASIWYTWTAPSSGSMSFDTIGSGFNTILAVYTWPVSSQPLVEIAANDDAAGYPSRVSQVLFSATKGAKYYIAVDGYNGATGQVSLNWKAQSPPAAPPANDKLSNATPIKNTSGTKKGTNVGATKESREPDHAGRRGGTSIWYAWTAPSNGTAAFDTTGSSFDTLLAVYLRAASDPPLTQVVANDNVAGSTKKTSALTFPANKGVKYYVAVDGYNGITGQVVLNWKLTAGGSSDSSSRPPDVAEQFETSGYQLGATCLTAILDAGQIRPGIVTLEKPAMLDLCFLGFNWNEPIDVWIHTPDYQQHYWQLDSNSLAPTYGGRYHWQGILPLDYPAGEYRLRAVQGNLLSGFDFFVNEAVEPRIAVDPNIRLWDDFKVYLAGFPPNSQVPLYFFNQVSCPPPTGGVETGNRTCYHVYYQYPVLTNPNGQGSYTFTFDQESEVNNYVIKAQAPDRVVSTSVFEVSK